MADISPFAGLRYAAERVGDLATRPLPAVRRDQRGRARASWRRAIPRTSCASSCRAARTTRATRPPRRLLASWTAEGHPAARSARGVLPLRAAVRRTAAGATRGAGSSPPCGSSRSSAASCCRTRRRCRRRRKIGKRLLRATRTQISPVFGLYRDAGGAARAIIDEAAGGAPAVDATTADGVRHRLWVMTAAPALDGLRTLLADKQILIADGHHRYETMLGLRARAAAARRRGGRGGVGLRDDVPGARRGSRPAGAADASAGERPARLQLRRRCARRRPRRSTIAQGDETTAEAIEARLAREGGRSGWCSRCARPAGRRPSG